MFIQLPITKKLQVLHGSGYIIPLVSMVGTRLDKFTDTLNLILKIGYLIVFVYTTLFFRICKGSNRKVVCLILHNFGQTLDQEREKWPFIGFCFPA